MMSVNVGSTIFRFASLVIYVPIGCRHPFMRYWQPLLAKTTVTCSLPHPEKDRQQSVNRLSCQIFGNQGIARIFAFRTEFLTTLIGNNTIYQRQNTDFKIIDFASCKACKNILLVVENVIMIRSYSQTPKTRALYESMNWPAGRPADNPPNSAGLGV